VVALVEEAVRAGARQQQACEVIELSARTFQRWIKGGVVNDQRLNATRPVPANKLTEHERQAILRICNEPAYSHLAPCQIVPMLLDQGIYIASESSFYLILKAANQLTHRGKTKPKIKDNQLNSFTATKANQVWSWDITYCPSRVIGQHYYLYMMEDIYSRKIVGWEVYDRESGNDAATLLERSVWTEQRANNLHNYIQRELGANRSPKKEAVQALQIFNDAARNSGFRGPPHHRAYFIIHSSHLREPDNSFSIDSMRHKPDAH